MGSTSFRGDDASEAALAYLEGCGMSRSAAIRQGLVELADRRRRAALLAEVAELSQDPGDQAEKAAVMALMDALASDEAPA